jgi:nitrogen regulatory protein PII
LFSSACWQALQLAAQALEAPSDMLDRVIKAIEKSANTGKIGDGKIFVYELEQVVRIRTGESGANAL